ncbi:hypothetical protein [Pseudomonas sp. NBRC 111124]|uniref:hypothetical protein n=1 Tax=Pseudomonas sp. NBRC 111124 TaxID=1661039 RepID=UPI0012E2A48D|nr:hypothetical protein [Pseudomonas sp. NBRC 111124]
MSWVAIPLLTLVMLGWREATRPDVVEPVGQDSVASASPVQEPLPTVTLALAFGFSEPGQRFASQAGLVLKPCFIPSRGQPRALVGGREGDSFYSVGSRLPGGSVLRRIEVGAITLWVDGREETLTLSSDRARVFVQSGSSAVRAPAPSDSPRLLREVQ